MARTQMMHAISPGSHRFIKPDPDGQTSPTFRLRTQQTGSNSSDAGSSTNIAVDQSFYRITRSDAPAPSDRAPESEPLLREVRQRPQPQPIMPLDAINQSDESFSFHISFQNISKKLKACNDTLGELQQLGVSHDVQLPELVLVGDQSAGKSSLMSGLANLDLPRSEGTCTRCPLHIRVSRNPEWSCRVTIRKEYKYEHPGGPIREEDVTSRNPFYPWRKLPNSKSEEFKVLQDKSQIEDTLRWAQIAVLNDDVPVERYVPGSGAIADNTPIDQVETSSKFSPNVVALEIKGPDFPDLSFYDLPGIFQSTAHADDLYLVKVVRHLSQEYIQHPTAIILCAIPMNSDAENSCTWGMISRHDAKQRTIGVLTKADLMPDTKSSHEQWSAILRKETHCTGLGYFVTSRPQGQDLDSLKKWEDGLFFAKTGGHWPKPLHDNEERCGVEKLMIFLSNHLGEEFAHSLPSIKQKVKAKFQDTKNSLKLLPDLPDKIEVEVRKSLHHFGVEAHRAIDQFCATFNEQPRQFQACLLEIKPKFIMKDASDNPVIEISDDGDDGDDVTTNGNGFQQTPTKRRHLAASSSTPKRQRTASGLNGSSTTQSFKTEDGTPPPPPSFKKKKPLDPPYNVFASPETTPRTLRQMSENINQNMGAGIPDHIPTAVYEDIIVKSIQPWKGPMEVFLEQSIDLVQSRLDAALSTAFCDFKKRLIYAESQAAVRRFLAEKKTEFLSFLMNLYKKEAGRLYTMNETAFLTYKEDALLDLRRFRHHHRLLAQRLTTKEKFIPWEQMDDHQKQEDKKDREKTLGKIGTDRFEREVMVMAYVRGYYRLAALRFTDDVAQSILCLLIPELRFELQDFLESQLGVRGDVAKLDDSLNRLMEEDVATANKRRTLKQDLQKFEKALEKIDDLQTGGRQQVMNGDTTIEDLNVVESEESEDDGTT